MRLVFFFSSSSLDFGSRCWVIFVLLYYLFIDSVTFYEVSFVFVWFACWSPSPVSEDQDLHREREHKRCRRTKWKRNVRQNNITIAFGINLLSDGLQWTNNKRPIYFSRATRERKTWLICGQSTSLFLAFFVPFFALYLLNWKYWEKMPRVISLAIHILWASFIH